MSVQGGLKGGHVRLPHLFGFNFLTTHSLGAI